MQPHARRRPTRGVRALLAALGALTVAAGVAAPPAGATGTSGTTGGAGATALAGTSGTPGPSGTGTSGTGTSGTPPTTSSSTTTTTTPAPSGGPGTCNALQVPTTTTTTTSTTTTTTTTPVGTSPGGVPTQPGAVPTTTPVGTSPGGVPTQPGAVPTTTTPPTTTTGPTTTTQPAQPPSAPPAYDLVASDGTVDGYGNPYTTTKTPSHLHAPVVGATPTSDGGGYWLAAGNGSVYNFGDAGFYGSPAHSRQGLHHVVGIAALSDSEGYWLTTSGGAVYAYGQAAYCGGANTRHHTGPIVGIAATPDGAGYWLASEKGSVYNFGDAHFYGSGIHVRTKVPVVAIAPTPDGKGYWLAYANGSVRNYGDAHFFGSAVHRELPAPIVAIAPTADGGGYWLTTAKGNVYNYGDAPFHGSLAHHPPAKPVTIVAVLGTHRFAKPFVSPFTHGALGYDISNFQCTKRGSTLASAKLPTKSAVEVIEVVGWLDSAKNSCLTSEAAWATRVGGATGDPYSLYMFMNSPGNDATARLMEATGPAGTCTTLSPSAQAACDAYNYGYNGAADALSYATSQGVTSRVWWLDVENDALAPGTTSNFSANQYWSGSTALNDQTIQGAIDAVRKAGDTAGIYSTSIQYKGIAGSYVPKGPKVPLWIAGVPWTSPPFTERGLPSSAVLAPWCAGTAHYAGTKGTDLFAGGVPWLLQETPGSLPSPYGLDPDYAC